MVALLRDDDVIIGANDCIFRNNGGIFTWYATIFIG